VQNGQRTAGWGLQQTAAPKNTGIFVPRNSRVSCACALNLGQVVVNESLEDLERI